MTVAAGNKESSRYDGWRPHPRAVLVDITGDNGDVKSVCGWWDGWHAYFDARDMKMQPGTVSSPKEFKGDKEIEWAKVLAVPLYSITSVEYVGELMQRVREAQC